MHETSLVQFTLNAVEQRALTSGISHVSKIHLVIGDVRGALSNLMQGAFRHLILHRPLFEGAKLEIETRSVVLQCNVCGKVFDVTDFHDVKCPVCGERFYKMLQGNEMYIEYFEGE